MQLIRAPGLNQRQLAERLEVHPVTINQIVDRLVLAGWIRREPCPQDRRAVRLHLTEASGPMMVELNRVAESVRATSLVGISDSERRQLAGLLARIKANFSESPATAAGK
jgi:DNA-binding MarR family transcriptional regulator